MGNDDADPHHNAARFVGKVAAFDHAGRRLVGLVEAQRYVGRTPRGEIPNYELSVRGTSGSLLKVNMVESYTIFREST